MERLTQRKNGGTFFSEDGCNMCGYAEKRSSTFCENLGCHSVIDRSCPYLQIIDRLAAYEDTGLTPEQIVAMKAELEDMQYRHDRVQDFCVHVCDQLDEARGISYAE